MRNHRSTDVVESRLHRRLASILAAATIAALAGGTDARAQSSGPTLSDWWRSPPAASSAAPASSVSARPTPPAPPNAAPAPPPSRFYVRGDVGVGLRLELDQTSANCSASSLVELCGYSAAGDAGRSIGGTLGFGYRVAPWLRADATFSYRSGQQVTGTIDSFAGQPAAGTLALGTNAYTLMFNVYVDVAPAIGFADGWFQPYIGAGFGPSFNHVRASTVAGALPSGFAAAQLAANTTTDIAWNAGGGAAFRLTRRFALDLGYRYVDLGGFETGSGTTRPTVLAVDELRVKTRLHELYLGFRLALN